MKCTTTEQGINSFVPKDYYSNHISRYYFYEIEVNDSKFFKCEMREFSRLLDHVIKIYS